MSVNNRNIYRFILNGDTATLNINKASGDNGISHKMLKETAHTISKPLLILFNRSLQECIFPSSWKHANVMPLFKKGSKHLTSNYRPISLLSCVGKVFERIMFKHIYNYVYTNKLIFEKPVWFFTRSFNSLSIT